MDKHPRGAFTDDPALVGAAAAGTRENGQFLTTKFFGMKINQYMHDHGISQRDAGQGRGQELPQRRAEPECVPAQADLRGGDPRLADAELPADAVHVLRARRGRRRGRACAAPTSRTATPTSRSTCGRSRSAPAATAPSRCTPRALPSRRTSRRRCTRRRGRIRDGRHRHRGRRRDPAAGHRRRRRGHPHGRERVLRRRRAGEAARRRRHRDRRRACRSTPTAG